MCWDIVCHRAIMFLKTENVLLCTTLKSNRFSDIFLVICGKQEARLHIPPPASPLPPQESLLRCGLHVPLSVNMCPKCLYLSRIQVMRQAFKVKEKEALIKRSIGPHFPSFFQPLCAPVNLQSLDETQRLLSSKGLWIAATATHSSFHWSLKRCCPPPPLCVWCVCTPPHIIDGFVFPH